MSRPIGASAGLATLARAGVALGRTLLLLLRLSRPSGRVRFQKRDVVIDRPLNPLFFNGQMSEVFKLRALPSDCANVGRWCEKLCRNCLAPPSDESVPTLVVVARDFRK